MGTLELKGEPPHGLAGLQTTEAHGSGGVVRLLLRFSQMGELVELETEMPVAVALSLSENVKNAANDALR